MFSLATPITALINKSFSCNKFPDRLKVGKLQPLFKKGDKTVPQNYRPISQLSIISSIIEKVATEQFNEHCKSTGIHCKTAFGFKKMHSCQDALIVTRHFIEMKLAQKKFVLIFQTDLSRAFDTVESNEILPAKLAHFGMSDNSVKWMKSFFHNRKQYTVWNGTKSSETELHNISICQGSNQGPSCYNLYQLDISKCSNFQSVGFADDQVYILSADSIEELISQAQIEVNKVLEYLKANFLSLNESKCEFMICRPKDKRKVIKQKLQLNSTEIIEAESMTFLGTILNNNLDFKPQIRMVIKRMQNAIHALIRSKYTLSYKAKILIYNGIFKPILDYSALCWLDKLKQKDKDVITKLQKRAVRLIFKSRFNTHTAKLFKISKIVPFEHIFERESIIFCKKLQNNELPTIFQELMGEFQISNVRKAYQNTIKIPSNYKQGQILFNIAKCWNNCDSKYKNVSKTNTTKSLYKSDIIKKLEKWSCERTRCYMCNRDAEVDFEAYAGIRK